MAIEDGPVISHHQPLGLLGNPMEIPAMELSGWDVFINFYCELTIAMFDYWRDLEGSGFTHETWRF